MITAVFYTIYVISLLWLISNTSSSVSDLVETYESKLSSSNGSLRLPSAPPWSARCMKVFNRVTLVLQLYTYNIPKTILRSTLLRFLRTRFFFQTVSIVSHLTFCSFKYFFLPNNMGAFYSFWMSRWKYQMLTRVGIFIRWICFYMNFSCIFIYSGGALVSFPLKTW